MLKKVIFLLYNFFGNNDFPEGLHLCAITNKCHYNAHTMYVKAHGPIILHRDAGAGAGAGATEAEMYRGQRPVCCQNLWALSSPEFTNSPR